MDRRAGKTRWLIAAMLSWGMSSPAVAELPKVKEILAIHRANQAKLSQLHLQLVHTYETTEAACREAQQRADELEKSMEAFANLTSEQIETLEITVDGKKVAGKAALELLNAVGFGKDNRGQKNELEHLRAMSKPWSRSEPMEIFLSGDDYQVRRPLRDFKTDDELATWVFPEVALTAESLLGEYGEMRIHSRSSSEAPPMRWWAGSAHATGYISSKHIGDHYRSELPAYTSLMQPSWGNRHLIDTFFSTTEENYRVVKQEEIEGRLVTVVDALVPRNPQSPGFLLRGWLDLNRGAVPVKVFETQVTSEAKLDTFDHWKPSAFLGSHGRTATTTEIRELPNGGFYPARTVREDWGRDADAPQLSVAEWAEVGAGKRDRPATVVHRRHTWACSLVEVITDWEDGFFVIPFSDDLKIYDYDAEKVVGGLEQKPLVKVGQPAPPLSIARWVDGKERTLADFQGQVVVLDFWGLWCGACRSAVPQLNELQSKFENRPVAFISIHSAEADSPALAKKSEKFATENDWKFVAAIDSGKMLENSVTTAEYGIKGFPSTVIIGPDGKIVYVDDDTDGPTCDEEDPVIFAAFEKKFESFWKERFAAVGEEWVSLENLEGDEGQKLYERVQMLYLVKQVERALEKAGR